MAANYHQELECSQREGTHLHLAHSVRPLIRRFLTTDETTAAYVTEYWRTEGKQKDEERVSKRETVRCKVRMQPRIFALEACESFHRKNFIRVVPETFDSPFTTRQH